MKFLFPYFLFALAAVAIPIIIHLFNFRRFKTVYFSNVEFLKNIKKESKKKSRLKQLLILIARILVVSCLVFAFSQPYLPLNNHKQTDATQTVAVYIDNSFSMNAKSEQGQVLEIARNKAIEIAREYKPGTKFMLITNDLHPKHQHLLNREQFIQQVTEVETSPNVVSISRIYNRLKESFNNNNKKSDKNFYFLSDFQREVTDIQNFETDSTVWSFLMPLYAQQSGNLFIDSCWFETPSRKLNEEEELFVKIVNRSDEDYQNLPLNFYMNDSLKSLTNFNIAANEEIQVSLKFTNMASGIQLGKVELTDYPVTYDNSYYISYKVQPEIKVLAIYNNTSSTNGLNYFKALFTEDNYAKLDEANDKSLQISKLGNYNTIILINPEELTSGFINELEQAASNGSSIIFFPSLKGNITNYNRLFSLFGSNTITGLDTMSQELSGVAFEHPVYSGIFKEIKNNVKLPVINGHYKFSSATRIPETKLLWFKNGGKALSSIAYDDGFLYTFAFPANNKNENFVKDIIFVPTLYSIVLNSIARQKISYAIGTDEYLLINQNEIPKSNPSIIIQGTNNSKEFIPETLVSDKNKLRIDVVNQISKAGFYLLKSDNKTISPFAFNYNRSESDLRYFTSGELESQIAQTGSNNIIIIKNSGSQFSEIFEELQNGKQLWKWFILFALLFVIAEALIIRLWK